MSIFDMLRRAWKESESESVPAPAAEPDAPVTSTIKAEAARLAAKQALAAAGAAMKAAGDELLDDLEGQLAQGEQARERRRDVRPDSAAADAVAARIEETARRSEEGRMTRAERLARAREELARMKGELPPDEADGQ